ncbi:MAG TPA: chromate resistance protein ChrB domain-containing protein [Burkholderiales bacterium]|nr:chromate resistance protein ChrB domain-containing protein [Burkholderiales bacterium]
MYEALVLSLPTRDSTLRMRVWRALKDTGCAVLRDGVYLLPAGRGEAAALDRLEKDIRAYGGFAMRLRAEPAMAADEATLKALFDRTTRYGTLVEQIAAVKGALGSLGPKRARTAIGRMEQALQKLQRVDFFPGQAQQQAAAALEALRGRHAELHSPSEPRASMRGVRRRDRARYQKRLWATRRSPWVDRLASCWLIKRFVDREARFTWLARPSDLPKKAVGFDFDGAEFTHVKNRVTFEILMASFGLEEDPALQPIARAVHFLDVGGIPVPEAKVLETMLKGAREKARSDDALLAEAMRTLDLLYSGYRSSQALAT